VPPMKRLLDVLREECGLTGTKEGCGEGECGACSILIDGRTVCSCLVPAVQAGGARIVTVEGLARGPRLSSLQRAFLEFGGAQCGICTPGMLITSMELLRLSRGRTPKEDEVREALAGNLCRCTGYQKIVDAVIEAARAPSGGRGTRRKAGRTSSRKTGRTSNRKTGRNASRKTGRTSSRKTGRRTSRRSK